VSTSTSMVVSHPFREITAKRRGGSGPGPCSPRRCSSLCKSMRAAPGAEWKARPKGQLSDHTRSRQLNRVLTSKLSRGEYKCRREPTMFIRPLPTLPPSVGLRATTLVMLARVLSEITCFRGWGELFSNMIERQCTCLHAVPKGNVEKVNAANPAQSNADVRIGGVVVITLEQGGRIDSQAESIGRPYNLLQFACVEITFHQYEFGLDLTKEWRLSFSIERRALPRVRTSSTGRSFRPSGSLICSPSSPK